MDIIYAIILGITQGLTEFLPVSSSGHLVILQHLFGFKESNVLFDCSLHIGTLLAVFIYFFDDIKKLFYSLLSFNLKDPDFQLAIYIIVGSIPTAIIGFEFQDFFERTFNSPFTAGIMLCVTGIFLWITKYYSSSNKKNVGILNSLLIGTAQGIAIIPGISRSGATISCGLICKLERETSFRFSFLLSIPAIIGAFLLEVTKVNSIGNLCPLISGTISSVIVGLLALKILSKIVKKGQLHYFSPYCIGIGIITIIVCYLIHI